MKKTYRIVMEVRPAYLYVAIFGTIRGGGVTRLAKEIIHALRIGESPGLLLDVRNLRMYLDPLSALSLVRMLPRLSGEMKVPTMIVHDAVGRPVVKIYETVMLNRGYSIWTFPDIGDAEACLEAMWKRSLPAGNGTPDSMRKTGSDGKLK